MKKYFPLILLLFSGCFLIKGVDKDDDVSQSLYIKSSTAKKIELKSSEVKVYEESSGVSPSISKSINGAQKIASFSKTITSVARVLPVEVNGLNVQANDIILKGNEAYVSYNYANELFKGAIQIININSADEPAITEEILFEKMDINCLYLDGNKLIFGGAADPEIYTSKSFIGVIENVTSINLNSVQESLKFFPHSHGVTSITKKGSDYYISAGAKDGKIYQTDSNFNIKTTFDKADVRDMEEYKNGVIAIKGTTDNSESGKIMLINDSSIVKELDLSDFSSDYNKVTIEMYNQELAFIGMSKLGFQVYDISASDALTSVFTLANPDTNQKHVTNSVSYDNNLVFIANGEYGVRLINIKDITKTGSQFGEIIGYIDFQSIKDGAGQNYSANHVAYKSNYLFIASGVGGVNIYTVK